MKIFDTRQAARKLGLTLNSFYSAVKKRDLKADEKKGCMNYYSAETLEAWRRKHPRKHTPERIPDGWVSISELMREYSHIRRDGETDSGFRFLLWSRLKKCGVEVKRCRCTASPNYSCIVRRKDADSALLDFNPPRREKTPERHIVAPPEIIASKKWVTVARAAEIIGCTPLEIFGKVAKYTLKSFLCPVRNVLLVNRLEVAESMRWRSAKTIRRFLGDVGFRVVARTCKKKIISDGAGQPRLFLYYVPELIDAYKREQKNAF